MKFFIEFIIPMIFVICLMILPFLIIEYWYKYLWEKMKGGTYESHKK